MKLRKWVKVTLTIIIAIISTLIYMDLGDWGVMAKSNSAYELMSILGWGWMVIQIFVLSIIWEA